jgi:drug/metabolite transporter, DME family
MRRRSAPGLGAAAVLAAAALWGSIGVLSVGLFRLGVVPWEVAFWRAALASGLLAAGAACFDRGLLRVPAGRDLLLLGGYGMVSVGLFYASYQLAIALTSVAVAVVLLYTAPVWVLLGARLLLGEPLDGRKLLIMAVVIAGVWATAMGAVGVEIRVTAAGVGWGLIAAISYASYYLFGKRYLPRFGVARVLLFSLLAGTLVLAFASPLAGHPPRLGLGAPAWFLLLALALGTTLLANGLYYWGLGLIEAGRAAVLTTIEPVIAALLALALFQERLSPLGWFGIALVVAGVAAVPTQLDPERSAHGSPDAAGAPSAPGQRR